MTTRVLLLLFFSAHVHAKPALLTTGDGKHSVILSAQAVACSGNVLQTLIEADEREIPTISLDAIEAAAEQEAHQDLMLFAHHLERLAAMAHAYPNATDNALQTWLTPTVQQLPLPTLARLFKHADFYGIPVLLPVLEEQLLQKIINDRATLATQLAVNNNPSWLASLPNRACNEVLAQKIMLHHPTLFFAAEHATHELNGHTDWVRAASFSPNGSKIVTSSDDIIARVWQQDHLNRWIITADLLGHSNWVRDAQFSPDGTKIITTSDDRTARIWQKNKNKRWITTAILKGHTDHVLSGQFSTDSAKVVTASADHRVRVWHEHEEHAWILMATLQGHTYAVVDARFNNNNSQIITASTDGTARIWQLDEHNTWVTTALLQHARGSWFRSAQFSPNNSTVVTTSKTPAAHLWQRNETGQWIVAATLQANTKDLTHAQFSPDGLKIVTASCDEKAYIWHQDIHNSWQILATLRCHTSDVLKAQFSPDGTKIATASCDSTALIWQVHDVVAKNNQAGLLLRLEDVLPVMEQLDPTKKTLWPHLLRTATAGKKDALAKLIATITLRSYQPRP